MKKKEFVDYLDFEKFYDPMGITKIDLDFIAGEMPMGNERRMGKELKRHRKRSKKFFDVRYQQLTEGDKPISAEEDYFFQQRKNFIGQDWY
jgi:hypothetical protein